MLCTVLHFSSNTCPLPYRQLYLLQRCCVILDQYFWNVLALLHGVLLHFFMVYFYCRGGAVWHFVIFSRSVGCCFWLCSIPGCLCLVNSVLSRSRVCAFAWSVNWLFDFLTFHLLDVFLFAVLNHEEGGGRGKDALEQHGRGFVSVY